jgi:hypothetical protein
MPAERDYEVGFTVTLQLSKTVKAESFATALELAKNIRQEKLVKVQAEVEHQDSTLHLYSIIQGTWLGE